MSMLSGFTSFNFEEGVPCVSVTKNGVTFNKAVIMKLGYPSHVILLINKEQKMIAVQKCTESTTNSTTFYKKKENSDILSVRWNAKDLLNTIQEMMDWDLSMDSFRISGSLLEEEEAMLFDLTTAKRL